MIVLYAGVLIAHLSSTDAHHDAATALLLDTGPHELLVHSVTLAEVLVRGARIGQEPGMRDALYGMGVSVAPHDDDQPLRLAQLRVRSGLTLPDCCVLDVAVRHRAMLATFDDRLAAVAGQHGVRVRP